MEMMKDGYKMTEVGVIPMDWEVKTYGEIFNFLTELICPVKVTFS